MAFIDELEKSFAEFLELLGQLAGNEAFLAHIDACVPEDDGSLQVPDGLRVMRDWFKVPGTYSFEVERAYFAAIAGEFPEKTLPTPEQVVSEIQLGAERAWSAAYDVCVGTTLGRVGRDVWEPDVVVMGRGVEAMGSLVEALFNMTKPESGYRDPDDPGAPDWVKNLKRDWPSTSKSSESFYAFWDDVDDKCAQYLVAAERLAEASARAAIVVHDFQVNLLEITQTFRDHVEIALQQWQKWKVASGYWPDGTAKSLEGLKGIISDASMASGVLSLKIGPFGWGPLGWLSSGLGALNYIIPSEVANQQFSEVATSASVWASYQQGVSLIDASMRLVLDAINTLPPQDNSSASASQGLQSYVADVVANRRNWSLPQVNL